MMIARVTGDTEILGNGLALMLRCDDVVNLKGQRIKKLRNPAVFATALGTGPNFLAQSPVH